MIEIKNVSKEFIGKDRSVHALKDVSLEIQDGDIFGVIGYSGAGKSTLVRCINQLEVQTSGEIIIDGVNMEKLNKKELRIKRQEMGMIFQHFNLLWSKTILENVIFPLEIAGVEKNKREERAMELIRLVGLEGREHDYPSTLSGGQKQRVGIARALANRPKILLCDEATSALDPETTEQILHLLKKIHDEMGLTIVMITHQMEVVQKICNRMAVMSDGEVVELGNVKDLFAHPKHEVTRRFVQNVEPHETIEELTSFLKQRYPDGKLIRVSFTGNNADEPIISKAIREVNFPVSIVESNLSQCSSGTIGVTYLHLYHGTEEEYQIFIDSLKKENVEIEEVQE